MRLRLAATSWLLLTLPLAVQAQSVAETLRSGGERIAIADLPAGYRAVTIGEAMTSSLFVRMGALGASAPGAGDLGAALGATWVDPDEFAALLEGRTPRIRGYAAGAVSLRDAAIAPDPARFPALAPIWIERGQISSWTPLPRLTPAGLLESLGIFREAREASRRTAALSAVKQLSTGVLILMGDADDVFPRVNSSAEMQKRLNPYVKNDRLWTSPNGGRILYNVALSRLSFTSLENPAATLLFWEETAWSNGTRAVAFADGHAKLLNPEAWDRAWHAELDRRAKARR